MSHRPWTPTPTPRHNLHNQVWKAGWSTPKTHMPCLHHLPLPTTTPRQVKRVILNRPPEKGLLGQVFMYLQSKREVWGHHGQGGSKWQVFLLPLWVPTFLGDADRATAHAHTKPIHTSINQVLGLGCRHHWGRKNQKEECEAGVPTLPRSVLGYPSTSHNLKCWARPILPSTPLPGTTSLPRSSEERRGVTRHSPFPPITWRWGYFCLI